MTQDKWIYRYIWGPVKSLAQRGSGQSAGGGQKDKRDRANRNLLS